MTYQVESTVQLWPLVAEMAHGGAGDDGDGGDGGGDEKAQKPPKPKDDLEIKLVDGAGKPVPFIDFMVKVSDGRTFTGTLDAEGYAILRDLDPGQCEVSFPSLEVTK